MTKSLRARFNGNAKEFLDYVGIWGRQKAMDKYGIKSYTAISRFIEENTGDKNFGLYPVLGNNYSRNLAEELLDAFTNKLHALEAENKLLKEENKQLKIKLDYKETDIARRIEPRVYKLLKNCET